jgi:hypothetical protein
MIPRMARVVERRKRATIADLEALPETTVGEVIDGVLYAFPRPAFGHPSVKSSVTTELNGPFQLGRRGPGGDRWSPPAPKKRPGARRRRKK